jgi:signal transduction histidine kinase/DNA-binding NarL/FixJ family response regulator/ligand-binding sensor domain-containing protein
MTTGPLLIALGSLLGSPARAAPELAPADGWIVEQWTSEDGLPTDHAMDVARTPDGALWVATTSGLLRFDGAGFERVGDEELPGLRTSRHVELAVHPVDGALWILSDHGQAVSRLHDGALQVWDRARGFEPGGGCLEEDEAHIWLCTTRGLYALSDRPEPALADLDLERVHDIVRATDGALWVASMGEVVRVAADGSVSRFGAEVGVLPNIGGLVLDADDRPTLVAGFFGQAYRWDGERFQPIGGEVRGAGSTVLTERAVPARGAPSSWTLSTAGVHRAEQLVLPFDGRISSSLAEADGSLWLTTLSAGVLRIRPAAIRVARDGVVDPQIGAVLVDGEGRLWLRGMASWWTPGADGHEPLLASAHDQSGMLFPVGGELRIAGAGIFTVREDGDGTRSAVKTSDKLFPYAQASEVEASGRLWLAGRTGLFLEDEGGSWTEWTDDEGAHIAEVRDLLPHPGGGLLVAAGGQGVIWAEAPGRSRRLDADSGAITDNPRHLRLAGERLWVSTEDAGLCAVPLAEAEASPWRCVGLEEGLPARGAHVSVNDERGRVWVSTDAGIAVARAEQLEAFARGQLDRVGFLVLDERDGMPSAECNGGNDRAFAWDPQGWLWFPTQDGAVGVHPASFTLPSPPEVRLGEVFVGTEPADGGQPTLQPGGPPLRIGWSTAEGPWSERAVFRYRVGRGEWSAPQEAREATFTGLPPGQSDVEVQAGLAGDWGPVASLAVTRTPRLQERAVFPLLLLALGGLGAGGVAWARSRAQRRRERALEEQVVARTEQLAAQKDQLAAQAARLSQLDDLRTRMIVNLHHELRTPVALVLGPLDHLLEQAGLDADSRRHAELARRSAEELEKLVGQLFDLTRLEAGELPVRARRIDLGALARRVTARHAYAAHQRSITLEAPEGSAALWCDPELIDKAISNLVGNALKFSPAGGTVRVELSREGEEAVLRVLDGGPGVPEAERSRIFERLFQVDRSDRRVHGGAGLGLALSREVVELHGGRIGVDGRAAGGSAFWLRLPVDDAPHSVEEVDLEVQPDDLSAADWQQPGAEVERPLALVVEDHPDMRAFLAAQLARSFRVQTAPDGRAALERALAEPPRVVVSDVMMPGMTGLELARALRAAPRLARVPILLVSAKASVEDRVTGLEVADDYLVKPFGNAELRARVRRLVERPTAPPAPSDSSEAPAIPDADAALRARLEQLADAQLADAGFGIAQLARAAAMSERTLRRELHRVAGEAPSDWLRQRRLLRGHALLEARAFRTVSEVAAAVGLSRSYFGRAYRAAYGRSPGETLAGHAPDEAP